MKGKIKILSTAMALIMLFVSVLSNIPINALAAVGDEIKFECESLPVTKSAGTINEIRSTADAACSGGKFYFMQSDKTIGHWAEFTLTVPGAKTYDVYVKSKDNPDRGIYDVTVDGSKLGAIDFYDSTATGVYKEHYIGRYTFASTTSKFKFTAVGKNSAATERYGMAADYFRLVETSDTPPPTPTATIINNEGKGYIETGSWVEGMLKGSDNSGTRKSNQKGSTAAWSSYADKDGNFNIYVWNPAQNVNGSNARYVINTLNGMWQKDVDQKSNNGQWIKLAIVKATGGTVISVTLNVASDTGETYADAVKFEYTTDPADPISTPGGGNDTKGTYVFVNQTGYDIGKPKRATVVNVPDGTAFSVINADTHAVAFQGTVQKGVGDFSDLNPTSKSDYYVECKGAISYTFSIGNSWTQKVSIEPALAFMNQSRQDVFNVGGNTGYGWRDSHQFSFELNSLVLQYMANPAAYDRMPYGIYKVETCEYPELRVQKEPDIIWLMKFGAERYYDLNKNHGKKLHMLIKEQLAYFLYIYPYIKQYVSEDFYKKIRDLTIEQWSEATTDLSWYAVAGENQNLFEVQKVIGGIKGALPPAHSVVPNLMMYEIMKRDGLGDGKAYFDAAYSTTDWLLNNIDIASPEYSKGQRMSEHVIMENLAYFQELYPEKAPSKLKAEIEKWADKVIARSNNMWDMRMASSIAAGDSQDKWTGAAHAGTTMNEPGNPAGMLAITLAASRVLNDNQKINRLKEIGISGIDDMFGRNPYGRAFFYNAVKELEGCDLGWFNYHIGGFGALEQVKGRIDASPKEGAYPFNPNADKGYTEGWIAFNTAWNSSLAYSAAEDVSLEAMDTSFKNSLSTSSVGETIGIKLKAPLNFDYNVPEKGYVVITDPLSKAQQKVEVTETAKDSNHFTAQYVVPNVPYIDISYGYGLFEKKVRVNVSYYKPINVEAVSISPSEVTVAAGENVPVSAVIRPEDANNKNVTWKSMDETIAAINNLGVITGKAVGKTQVEVTTEDGSKKAACTVNVTPAKLGSVTVTAEVLTTKVGVPVKLSISGKLKDNTEADISKASIVYSVDTGNKATVTQEGIVVGPEIELATVYADVTLDGVTVRGSVQIKFDKTYNGKFEFSQLSYSYNPASIPVAVASDNGASNRDLVTFKPTLAEGYIEFTTPVIPWGKYDFSVATKVYSTYGVFQVYVDGEAVGNPTDAYTVGSGFKTFSMGRLSFIQSKAHKVKIEVVGKNSASSAYNLALDYFTLSEQLPDKELLSSAILFAESKIPALSEIGYGKDQYTQNSVDAINLKIDAAKLVYDNNNATKEDISNSITSLEIAVEEFENSKLVVDKSELANAASNASSLLDNSIEGNKDAQYTFGSKELLREALKEAQVVLDNTSIVSQQDIDIAASSLKTAIENFINSKKVLTEVNLEIDNTNIYRTKTEKLALGAKDQKGLIMEFGDAQIDYLINNPEIVSVKDGVVTANRLGSADIIVKVIVNGREIKSNTITVQVLPIMEKITVTSDKDFLNLSNTAKLSVHGVMTDNEQAGLSNAQIAYSSDNKQIALVDENGAVKPIGQGTVNINISVTLNDITRKNSVKIIVDDTPPITIAKLDSIGVSGWYNADVTVTLSSMDNLSGVDEIEYAIDNGDWVVYTDTFIMNQEGTSILKYRSIDKAGSVEEEKQETIKIDKTKPDFELSVNGKILNDGGAFDDCLPLTFNGWDNLSSLSTAKITINGIDYTIDTENKSAIDIDMAGKPGNYIVTIYAEDIAGNTLEKNYSFKVVTTIYSMKELITRFVKSNELGGPLLAQLNSNLDQVQHQIDIGRLDQAAKHMEDFIKHFNNKALEAHIGEKVKMILDADANALIEILLNDNSKKISYNSLSK